MVFIKKIIITLIITCPFLLNSQTDLEKSDFINKIYNEAL